MHTELTNYEADIWYVDEDGIESSALVHVAGWNDARALTLARNWADSMGIPRDRIQAIHLDVVA